MTQTDAPAEWRKECETCEGEGRIEHPSMPLHHLHSEAPEYGVVTCEDCGGDGWNWTDKPVSLAECPIGLFWHGDTLCLKTEYGNNEGRIDAYIVSSGEFYWGDAPQTIASQRAQMVMPVEQDRFEAHLRSTSPDTLGAADHKAMCDALRRSDLNEADRIIAKLGTSPAGEVEEMIADSGMSGEAVERAEWAWANLPVGPRKWTSLPTHEKALVCHVVERLAASDTERNADYNLGFDDGLAVGKAASDTEAMRLLLAEAGARLKVEAVHMEYDCPGDVPEECGLWCRICADHVDDHSDHAPTCLIARIDAALAKGGAAPEASGIVQAREALDKCRAQFEFMAKLASGSRVYEVEKVTGKRVRKPLGQVISTECEVAAMFARQALSALDRKG